MGDAYGSGNVCRSVDDEARVSDDDARGSDEEAWGNDDDARVISDDDARGGRPMRDPCAWAFVVVVDVDERSTTEAVGGE